ncbi:hypothetical protein [Anaerotignum sp.]
MRKIGKSDKISILFLLVVLLGFIWLCRPLPEAERTMSWIWTEVDFWPDFENETELIGLERAECEIKIKECEPFQFSHPDLQTKAFEHADQKFIFSPEAGLLFQGDEVFKLTQPKGAFDGLYALGGVQKDGDLYYAEAEEKTRLWLPGLWHGEGILVKRFEMTYSRFDLQTRSHTEITEKEYLEIRDTFQGTE